MWWNGTLNYVHKLIFEACKWILDWPSMNLQLFSGEYCGIWSRLLAENRLSACVSALVLFSLGLIIFSSRQLRSIFEGYFFKIYIKINKLFRHAFTCSAFPVGSINLHVSLLLLHHALYLVSSDFRQPNREVKGHFYQRRPTKPQWASFSFRAYFASKCSLS